MRRGEQAVGIGGARLERPGVVRPAQRVGEDRVVHGAFPQQAQRGVEDLGVDALGVQKRDALVHVLPVGAQGQILVEMAHVASGLLLAIGDQRGQQVRCVDQLERLAVHQDLRGATRGVGLHAQRPVPEGRIDVARKQVERFHEVAVAVNHAHGWVSFRLAMGRGSVRRFTPGETRCRMPAPA